VRAPRRSSRWSRRRLQRRGQYDSYLNSASWYRKREQWYVLWQQRTGTEPLCAVCGRVWTLRQGHLHHRTYARLGHELLTDVVPLCAADHARLHDLWDAHPSWRTTGRATATLGIIAALRRQRRAAGSTSHVPARTTDQQA
jgi:5-methylcytosine-specific restriction endonuclease McrA